MLRVSPSAPGGADLLGLSQRIDHRKSAETLKAPMKNMVNIINIWLILMVIIWFMMLNIYLVGGANNNHLEK